MSKTVAIDFDGVISKYSVFEGKGVFGEPVPWAAACIGALKDHGWTIIIHSTRSETHQLKEYLERNQIPFDYINYNPENSIRGCNFGKPLADVYVDDRAVRFDGNWVETLEAIESFKPWWK